MTQKRKEDLSALGKVYQNTTAKYNGYFNADELMIATQASLESSFQDNYNQLLPIYVELTNENPSSLAPDMDKAIEKVTRVVGIHPYSQWTDDCYLLVGQAQYMKQDFESAEKALRYLVNNYDPIEIAKQEAASKASKDKKKKTSKKKKKKKSAKKRRREYLREKKKRKKQGVNKKAQSKKEEQEAARKAEIAAAKKAEKDFQEPDNYGLKHRPAHQEGQLWLARTLIERENYDAALRYLNNLIQNPKVYDDVLPKAWEALAYYYVYREDYGSAIQPLEQAIETSKGNKGKARKSFILAQIYEQINNDDKALATYQRVLKYSPDYEMEFNAKLNIALNSWRARKGSADQAIAELERLAKDDKNLEFKDQIYYAMAQIALEQGNQPQAIDLFRESLKYNVNNSIQKAESYLAIADLYFADERYVPAKNYYDSTATVMNKKDERYPKIESLSKDLVDIAKNILIIQEQDSLIKLSDLSDEELKVLAFEKFKAEQEAKRASATQQSNSVSTGPTRPSVSNIRVGALSTNSEFFAYDDRSVKRGIRDFQRKWGNRPLEDNWRRSAAITGNTLNNNAQEVAQEVSLPKAADALTEAQLKELLSGVPRTESDLNKAKLKIIDAMYELGTLYRDRLENNQKAVDILELLNKRFPRNNYELESWYNLYLAHNDLNNSSEAREYRRKIVDKYSSSVYARVLLDPNYAAKLADEEYAINMYYDDAYGKFQTGNYQAARQLAENAQVKFGGNNPLQARFDLLTALTIGKLEGETAYKNALSTVIARYPDTDEQRSAREILRILGGATAKLPGARKEVKSNFKYDENQVHFVIVAFNKDVNLNTAKVNISDYNKKYHRAQRLTVSNVFLGTDAATRIPMIIVRRYKKLTDAMRYYEGIQQNGDDFMKGVAEYEVLPVSLNNYREILRAKSIDGYREFFRVNYLKN